MKKILSLLLAFALLALGSAAFAEAAFDLSNLSSDELLALLADVQQEVAARRLSKTAHLLTGSYVGGRDVPVGAYALSAAGQDGQHGIVSLRAASDPADAFPSKLYEFVDADAAFNAYIHIDEGDTLVLPFPFTLTIHPGVMFN